MRIQVSWFTKVAMAVVLARALEAGAVPVRFTDGVLHGFLVLRTGDGAAIASGDLLQVAKEGHVESRMIFHFKDGSLSEERVVYTQQRVFAMQSYRSVQRGPAFPADVEISLERSGKYRVKTKTHKDQREEVLEGAIELPPDVYNGMVINVIQNLAKGLIETIHVVDFEPKPRVIELRLIPEGERKVQIGEVTKNATHYLIKPELGTWLKLAARVLGRVPPDYHAWILMEEIPAFLRADGPFFTGGPIWRIELTGPRWPN
jgi:hypothetical protein